MFYKLGCWLAVLLLLAGQAPAQPSPVQKDSFRIVGYYSLKAAMDKPPSEVPFAELTHVNLYFLNPDSLGNFRQDYSALKPFIAAAHAQGVKVLVSIAGGGKHPYYARLLQDDHREALVSNLVAIVKRYGLDGIDVDIEGGDIDENYDNFVLELSKALKQQDKLITAAVAVFYKGAYTDRELSAFDFVNVMSYDHTGPWEPDKPGPHATYGEAVSDLDYFTTERAMPAGKLGLGVPFYGYAFGATPDVPVSGMSYREIAEKFPGAESKDSWVLPDGRILYYNGIPTIKKKTKLAKRQASGIMIWQLSGDAPGDKSLLKAIREAASGQ
jgi:GH18 family chitinase